MKMKFLQFMVNTLPKARKSKKKNNPSLKRDIELEATQLATSLRRDQIALDELSPKHVSYKSNIIDNISSNVSTLPRDNWLAVDNNCETQRLSESVYSEPGNYASVSDANYNTIPRARSGIKTNPWLPSPHASPSPSPCLSTSTSPTMQDETNVSLFRRPCSPVIYGENTVTRHRQQGSMDSGVSQNESGYSTRVSATSDTDVSLAAHDCAQFVDSDDEATGDYDKRVSVTCTSPTVASVSFHYEEAFESQLERALFNETDSSCGDINDESDDVFRRQHEDNPCWYFDPATFTFDNRLVANADRDRAVSMDIASDAQDSDYGTTSSIEVTASDCTGIALAAGGGGRSVNEIRSSLQEKVSGLRQQKAIVDAKIREAQEEDRMSRAEKRRIQQQVTLFRKQLLLRTLADLKTRLDGQSERLQTSYSRLVHMQWTRAQQQRRSQRDIHRTPDDDCEHTAE